SRSPPDAITDAFSSSLTTTVFSQRSMRRFEASLRRATSKGHDHHHPSSIAPDRSPTSNSPSRSGHTAAPISLAEITAMPAGFDLPGMGAEVVGEVIWHAEHNHQVKIRLTP
ncbi:hypothetical protein, partial [Nonomuraea basaltis]|uniref:hypothetical protein n=1 Tax=Nonomuraea basaltis TaxID=2495887 RepID=UPI0019800F94